MTGLASSAPKTGQEGLLTIEGLTVQFAGPAGWHSVTDEVSFSIGMGETVGLVGESGSGKTVTALAVMGLLPRRVARVAHGSVRFGDAELTSMDNGAMRRVRGAEIGMIFQEPMTSLNPAFTVGSQIAESVRWHGRASRHGAWTRAVEMLDVVGISDPHRRARDYPHAFSGGMRQRAMIAMALACEPKLLIADEPTTALDVTIQAQVLELIRDLQEKFGMSVLFVTHDLGVVADICERVVVMYAGQVVEQASARDLFMRAQHPYTEALLASMPQLGGVDGHLHVIPGQVPAPDALPPGCRFEPRCGYATPACATGPIDMPANGARCVRTTELTLDGVPPAVAPPHRLPPSTRADLLEIDGVTKEFPVRGGALRRIVGSVRAVDDLSLTIGAGETLGLVGESGSGKSTVARLALRLIEPTGGRV